MFTTLDEVHSSIEDAIRTRFPTLATVEFYKQDRKVLDLPACLLEMSDLEPTSDPGTEQLAVLARFEARLVIGKSQGSYNPELEVRKLAAAFGVFCKNQRWGIKGGAVGPAEIASISEDPFSPDLDNYYVWAVEWVQEIFLGESVWDGEGVPITQVFLGISPDTGPENLDKYVQIYPDGVDK